MPTHRLRLVLPALLLPAILVAGCANVAAAPLDGRTFLSVRVTQGRADRPLVPGTVIRLTFGADGQLGASAGCNHLGGTYRIDGGVLRFEGGAMTEMGCDPDRHQQDDWLAGFLGARPTVTSARNDLTLTAGDTTIRLVDREVAEPDLPLAGPTWTVDSIVDGDAVSSVPGGVSATLKFSADGRFELSTGCNQGGGSWRVNGQQIEFGDIVLTKRACDGEAGRMEEAVLGVLQAPMIGLAIDASSLRLQAGPRGLVLHGG